jgi:hypothetical protein
VPSVVRWNENGRIIRENRAKIATVESAQKSFVRLKNATDRWTLYARSPQAGFLEASTEEDALTLARAHVEGIVDRHDGTLEKLETQTGETRRVQVGTVVLTLKVTLKRDRLVPFLGALEENVPYTFVSNFEVTRKNPDSVVLTLTGEMQRMLEAGL